MIPRSFEPLVCLYSLLVGLASPVFFHWLIHRNSVANTLQQTHNDLLSCHFPFGFVFSRLHTPLVHTAINLCSAGHSTLLCCHRLKERPKHVPQKQMAKLTAFQELYQPYMSSSTKVCLWPIKMSIEYSMDLWIMYNNNYGLNLGCEADNNLIKSGRKCYFSLLLKCPDLYT